MTLMAPLARLTFFARGKYTLKDAPSFGLLLAQTYPPLCFTIPNTVARPSPVP